MQHDVCRLNDIIVMQQGAFGAKTVHILHSLLDCLELDPSIYVRAQVCKGYVLVILTRYCTCKTFEQVVRLLGRVKYDSHHVVNKLLEISKGSGLIAR